MGHGKKRNITRKSFFPSLKRGKGEKKRVRGGGWVRREWPPVEERPFDVSKDFFSGAKSGRQVLGGVVALDEIRIPVLKGFLLSQPPGF